MHPGEHADRGAVQVPCLCHRPSRSPLFRFRQSRCRRSRCPPCQCRPRRCPPARYRPRRPRLRPRCRPRHRRLCRLRPRPPSRPRRARQPRPLPVRRIRTHHRPRHCPHRCHQRRRCWCRLCLRYRPRSYRPIRLCCLRRHRCHPPRPRPRERPSHRRRPPARRRQPERSGKKFVEEPGRSWSPRLSPGASPRPRGCARVRLRAKGPDPSAHRVLASALSRRAPGILS